MKRLIVSAFLLLLTFPMITGGGFEISGMMGPTNLLWAIALNLGAQVTVLVAGYIAAPKRGKIGFFRAVAFTFYLVQSVPIPVLLFVLFYKKFAHVELLESNHLVWALVISFSALAHLLFSARAWHLFMRPSEKSSTAIDH